MTDSELAALFHETFAAHHRAFASTDGDDPEWPRWYAAYLVEPLSRALGRPLEADGLAKDLAVVDAEYRRVAPSAPWTEYYAQWFARRYGA